MLIVFLVYVVWFVIWLGVVIVLVVFVIVDFWFVSLIVLIMVGFYFVVVFCVGFELLACCFLVVSYCCFVV